MVTSSVIVSSQLVPATQISLRNLRALCASALSFSSSYSPLSFFFSPRSFKLRKLEGSQSPSNLFRIKSFADPHPLTLMESHLYKKHRGGAYPTTYESAPVSGLRAHRNSRNSCAFIDFRALACTCGEWGAPPLRRIAIHQSLISSTPLPASDQQAYSVTRHGHQPQRRPSTRSSPCRLSRPNHLQFRPQNDRPPLPLARSRQRSPRNAPLSPDAHPPGLARRANSIFFWARQRSRALRGLDYAPRLADGFPGSYHRATSRLRQLLPASPNWRPRNGFPVAQSFFVLGHRHLCHRHHRVVSRSARCWTHALDRQRCALLLRSASHFHQFHRHHARPSRQRHDLAAHAAHRLGLVHQRHSQHVDFQHLAGRLRFPSLGPSARFATFFRFSRLPWACPPACFCSPGSARCGTPKSNSPPQCFSLSVLSRYF